MSSRSYFSLLYFGLASLLSCYCASWLVAEPDQLALSSSMIAQQFLADRQKSGTLSTAITSAPNPQNPSQSDSSFEPLNITLRPSIEIGPLPKWVKTAPIIDKESASVEISIPALAEQSDIENFAITVNFQDMGDGGPLLEVEKKGDLSPTLLCSGLGINGPALGMNSRTISIPADLALDGGKISVRHVGRFEQIHSIILRPGHTAMVSVLNENFFPAIMDESTMIEKEEADGAIPVFKKGDITHGRVTSAELSAPIEQLDGDLEFAFELTGHPKATIFHTEIQGLDLEAHVDVELNGTLVGPLNVSGFQLDSSELIAEAKNKNGLPCLQFAGWRKAYCYISPDLWKKKKSDTSENDQTTEDKKDHLLLIVRPGGHPSGSQVHLKNSCLEIL